MRRGIASLTLLLLVGLLFAGLATSRLLQLAQRPHVVSVNARETMRVAEATQRPPVPLFDIGLVNGRPGTLADLSPGSVLSDADLRGADWRGVRLRGVRFVNCDFTGARLDDADFRHAQLTNCDFTDTSLYFTRFDRATLTRVTFTRTGMGDSCGANTRFWEASLVDCGFSRCGTRFADLAGATYDRSTRWPAGFNPRSAGARLEE